jgi:hypothetical protein
LFTLSCCEHTPAPTTNDADAYIPGRSYIVNHFCEGFAGGQFTHLVTFGYNVPMHEPYIIVRLFGYKDITLILNAAREHGSSLIQEHPWMHMLMVTSI